jgi:hypothetical protein
MKTIGLIGGMRWESSAEYYRLLNLLVKERLGRHANAKSEWGSVCWVSRQPLRSGRLHGRSSENTRERRLHRFVPSRRQRTSVFGIVRPQVVAWGLGK